MVLLLNADDDDIRRTDDGLRLIHGAGLDGFLPLT
jgi:hypothetical protein